eukprot:3149164-Rhodomonas_salina.1
MVGGINLNPGPSTLCHGTVLRTRYALSGTDIAYASAATRRPPVGRPQLLSPLQFQVGHETRAGPDLEARASDRSRASDHRDSDSDSDSRLGESESED